MMNTCLPVNNKVDGVAKNILPERVIEVEALETVFHTQDGLVHAVNGVSFHVGAGELLGVVGESGSGKSVTMMSMLQLIPTPPGEVRSGRVMFGGENLLQLNAESIRQVRGAKIGFIFQDPMTSLNPVFTVGYQIMEPLRLHMGLSRRAARTRAQELLELVGIPSAADRLQDFPHQFSGGMRQRVMIAIALSCEPDLLIADEPTTALDVTVQAQIIELIANLQRELGMSIIWITHDLGVVAGIADRVAVMYAGYIVEQAPVRKLFKDPQHPYTQALLATLPAIEGQRTKRLLSISGQPPNLVQLDDYCPFAPRCSKVFERCRQQNPPLTQSVDGHLSACWRNVTPNTTLA